MTRKQREFFRRDTNEQRWMTENTWCETCEEADLGLSDPNEYEENDQVFLEGKCRKCEMRVVTHVTETNK